MENMTKMAARIAMNLLMGKFSGYNEKNHISLAHEAEKMNVQA
jgi:hypothetical protein